MKNTTNHISIIKTIAIIGFYMICSIKMVFSQTTWQEHTIFESEMASIIDTIDFDLDGDLDIVFARNRSSISWYENDGLGNFSNAQILVDTLQYVLNGFDIIDIDGDVLPDLVYTSAGLDYVVWKKNLGNQTFSAPQFISDTANGPSTVQGADIDGDGDLDIVVGLFSPTRIKWFENTDGNGTFGVGKTVPGSFRLYYIADMDGDNDLDLITKDGNNIVWVKNSDGLGNFTTVKTIIALNSSSTQFAVGDIDGDGDADIGFVYNGVGPDHVDIYFNNGIGTSFTITNVVPNTNSSLRGMYLANIDGLPGLEIIYGYVSGSSYSWVWASYSGGVSTGSGSIYNDVGASASFIGGDFDGDTDDDLIYVQLSLFYIQNFGGGAFFSGLNPISTDITSVSSVAVTDFNNNSKLDVISGSLSNLNLALHERIDINNNFKHPIALNETGMVPFYIKTGDIDNDGYKDIVYVDNQLQWVKNQNGVGGIGTPVPIASAGNSIDIGDVDNDGDIDIICSRGSTQGFNITLNKNNGFGNFLPEITLVTGANYTKVKFFDIDGDNDLDIVGVIKGVSLFWLENTDGLGTYSTEKIIDNTNALTNFAVIDVDGDNDLDLIGSNSNIYWLQNTNGLGVFGASTLIYTATVGFSILNLAASDIDNDGNNDVVFSSSSGYLMCLKSSNGTGAFNAPDTINTNGLAGIQTIQTIDFDNDGDIDIVSESTNSNKILWFENSSCSQMSVAVNATQINCSTNLNGFTTTQTTGGVTPYSYAWSNSATTQNISGLAAGVYTITVTDNNGCSSTNSATITQPPAITLSTTSSNSSCSQSNGVACVTATGGIGGYTYLWNNSSNSAITCISNVPANTYTVTVTDANSCVAFTTVTISGTTASALTASILQNISCNGGSDGVAQVSVTSGTTTQTYLWNDANSQTTASATGLVAGIYSVQATDANNCVSTLLVTITQPVVLNSSITVINNAFCNNTSTGSLTTTITNGVAPYTYAWSNSATTQNISGLAAGVYTVTVTDNSGCSSTNSATITQPSAISLTTTSTNSSCSQSNGVACVTATGGIGGYTYLWNNSSNSALTCISNVPANTYTVTVTDANSCVASTTVTINDTPASVLTASTVQNISCNGGSDGAALVSVSSGTTTQTYQWNDANSQTTASATGLVAGIYSVQATDANNCVSTLLVTITQPTVLSVSLACTNVSVVGGSDGSSTATISGGNNTNFSYQWSNIGTVNMATVTGLAAGTVSLTITNGNNCIATSSCVINNPTCNVTATTTATHVSCFGQSNGTIFASLQGSTGSVFTYNWSNSATTQNISGLVANTYLVTITDSNGCSDITNTTITEPTQLLLSNSSTQSTCNQNDGTATVTIVSGNPSFTYLWNDPQGQTTPTATGLFATPYSVTVTDGNNCTTVNSLVITDTGSPSMSILTQTDVSCSAGSDGFGQVAITGGTPPLSFLWNDAQGQTTLSASGLLAGNWSVTMTDATGCTASTIITITEPLPLATTIGCVNTSAIGASDGASITTTTGGTTPYTYLWSNGNTTSVNTNMTAGVMGVLITDNNGCTLSESCTISDPSCTLSVTTTVTNTSCFGAADGFSTATATGSNGNESYSWSNGQTTATVAGLSVGIYTVTVQENSCSAMATLTITEPIASFTINTVDTNATCSGGNDGSISVTTTGGNTPFSYLWNNGFSVSSASGLPAGIYTITVTENGGCSQVISTTISEPTPMILSSTNSPTLCGTSNGVATVFVSGGVAPYVFSWSNGKLTPSITGLSAGSYGVNVIDANNCYANIVVNLPNSNAPTFSTSVTDISCYEVRNGAINTIVSGGVAPYAIIWSTGQTTPNINALMPGAYQIQVTDANNCISYDSYIINEPNEMVVTPSISNSSCGSADGSANITVVGGTSPYSYIWNNGNTTPSISAVSEGTYTIAVIDANSCISNKTIAINETGAPMVSINNMVNVGCGNPNGSVAIDVNGGQSPYSFSWSNGSTSQNISGLTIAEYQLTVTGSNGCSSFVIANVEKEALSTDPICIITVDTTTQTNLLVWEKITNQGISHYNIYREGSIANVYQQIATVPFSTESFFVDSVANPAIRSWRYKITMVDSCNKETAFSMHHKTIHLTMNLSLNESVNLIWDHYEGFQFNSYTIHRYTDTQGWDSLTSLPSTLTSYTDLTPPVANTLFYAIEIRKADGCISTVKATSHNTSRSNRPHSINSPSTGQFLRPAVAFSVNTNAIQPGGNVQFTDLSAHTPTAWNWEFTGGFPATTTAQNPAVLYSSIGTYDVKLVASNANGSDSLTSVGFIVVGGTGINDLAVSNLFMVYPSPSKGEITVLYSSLQNESITVEVINSLGKLVYTKKTNVKAGQTTLQLNLQDKASGIYFVRLLNSDKPLQQAIVIE